MTCILRRALICTSSSACSSLSGMKMIEPRCFQYYKNRPGRGSVRCYWHGYGGNCVQHSSKAPG